MEKKYILHNLPIIQRILRHSGGNNIIAIASGMGHVGKTFISVRLAQMLAALGQKVLLFDADLGLPNIDKELNIPPIQDISAVLKMAQPVNKSVFHYEKGNFDVITGQADEGAIGGMTSAQIQLLIDDLLLFSSHYDYVIIDCANNQWKYKFMTLAQTVFVVCMDEVTNLTESYALVKQLYNKEQGRNIQVIVNMATSQKEGNRTYITLSKACDEFLISPLNLAGIIQFDESIVRAKNRQISFSPDLLNTQSMKDIEQILKTILIKN